MSYSLKIDLVISMFFFCYINDFAIIPMLNYILKRVCKYQKQINMEKWIIQEMG